MSESALACERLERRQAGSLPPRTQYRIAAPARFTANQPGSQPTGPITWVVTTNGQDALIQAHLASGVPIYIDGIVGVVTQVTNKQVTIVLGPGPGVTAVFNADLIQVVVG